MTTFDENQQELLAGFIDEAANSIIDLPESLKNILDDSNISEAINSVFRSVHSIKGNAGFFGLTAVKKFSHALENTLDDVRNSVIDLNEELYRSLVKGFDNLDELLRQVADGESADDLGDCELDLLSEIEENCGEVNDQRAVRLAQISSIAEEMTASEDPKALEWASQLMAILEEAEDSSLETSQDNVAEIASPEEMLQKKFHANGLDISHQVVPLIGLFSTLLKQDTYSTQQTDELTEHLNTVLEVSKQSNHGETSKFVEDAISNYHAV
ncbi:MAG: Hpt domain-containing protein [Pirellulales bacterium]